MLLKGKAGRSCGMKKILVINVGSTSTKVAYYEDRSCVCKTNLEHPTAELAQFAEILDQKDYRREKVEEFCRENGIAIEQLDAITARGGHTRPIPSGVFEVNEVMLREQASGLFGRHPSDIGSSIAYALAKKGGAKAFVVDTPVTDEYFPLARYGGHPLMPRQSRFHALSHKATAKRYCREHGFDYNSVNLVSIHLGGGTSVAMHDHGKMVDGTNGIEGDGPFSTNRSGVLVAKYLADIIYSEKYTREEVYKMIQGKGGLMAYLGEQDVQKCSEMAETDPHAKEVLEAMMYQTAKFAAGVTVAVNGRVDQILITGGIAHSQWLTGILKERLSFIAPITVYPGENEMESLAAGAYEALTGQVEIQKIED